MHPLRRRQQASRLPMSFQSDSLSPIVGTPNEKTQPVSQDTQIPTVLDDKAEADRRSPNTSPAPQPPASTRSTSASICIIAACTSGQCRARSGLCHFASIRGQGFAHPKENLQWTVNAYSISSVSDFEPTQGYHCTSKEI